jgi:membrane protein YdbS with pleckstrin-like domain
MSKKTPAWLPEARKLCRGAGIEISGWGSDTLLVKVASADQADTVASQLQPLGFARIEDEDDTDSGLLLLSRNSQATRAQQLNGLTNVDITRRPMIERTAPVLEASVSIWSFWVGSTKTQPASWFFTALASIILIIFLRDARRFWGWKLQISADELRVRRNFRWSAISWARIQAVDTISAGGRNQEAVTLTLTANAALSLGIFGYRFAHALRDRLRDEVTRRLAQRRETGPVAPSD